MPSQTLDQMYEDARARAKAMPDDLPTRSALWQILAARGEIDRARKQLDFLPRLDGGWTMEAQACHALLDVEDERIEVLAGAKPPVCLGLPPEWFGQLAAALQCLGTSGAQAALPMLAESWNSGEPRAGILNGEAFEWIRDGDARLGPCLEVIIQGKYYWAPWERIISLETKPPTEVRDRLWQPAMLQVSEEGAIEVFLPVRYPQPRDEAEMMARQTVWAPIGDDLYFGYGQKCLVTEDKAVGYLDVRELRVDGAGGQ
ncbi:MAG: hypothetical protein HY854_06125 [Burkholderiales bacterium]|nr:hypothetical protein [Burkholderiales bacterium]